MNKIQSHETVDGLALGSRVHGGPVLRFRLQLVGRFQATAPDGTSILPRARRSRAALAVLAYTAPGPVLRSHLGALLWSLRDREQRFGSMRQTVQELLRALAPFPSSPLLITRNDLRLAPNLIWIDLAEIAAAPLADASVLDMMDGRLLDDLDDIDPAFDAWLATARRKFRATTRSIGETLIALAQTPQEIIPLAEKLLRIDRTHEPFWLALVGAHCDTGDTARALTLLARFEALLAELSGTPSPAMRALTDQIRAAPHPECPPKVATSPPASTPDSAAASALASTATGAARGHRLTARLGVSPLQGLGTSGAELAFAVGESIIAALAGFRSISLIPIALPSTAAAVPFERSDEFGSHLDWVLEGSIQRGARSVRVTLRLLDCRRGGEIAWVKRIERDIDDLIQLQDDIAAEVAAQLDTRLLFLEAQHSRERNPADAYGLLTPAITSIYQLDQQRYVAAGDALAGVARMAPEFAAAYAWWAFWHVFLVGQGWADDAPDARRRAGELAHRAVMLDPFDARALALTGHVHGFLDGSHANGGVLIDRALQLNPYLPIAWVTSGLNRGYAGDHAEAIRRINRGRQLSPNDPQACFFDAALMLPTLLAGDFIKVVEIGERAGELNPRLSTVHRLHLSALGHLGRLEDATRLRRVLGALEPNFNLRDLMARSPISRPNDLELYVAGLRRAGVT